MFCPPWPIKKATSWGLPEHGLNITLSSAKTLRRSKHKNLILDLNCFTHDLAYLSSNSTNILYFLSKKITMRIVNKPFQNHSYPFLSGSWLAWRFLSLKFEYTRIFPFLWFQNKFSADKNLFIKMNLCAPKLTHCCRCGDFKNNLINFGLWTEKCLNCNCAVTLLLPPRLTEICGAISEKLMFKN